MFLAKLLKILFFNPAEKVYKLGFISESNLGERKTDVRDLGVGSRVERLIREWERGGQRIIVLFQKQTNKSNIPIINTNVAPLTR